MEIRWAADGLDEALRTNTFGCYHCFWDFGNCYFAGINLELLLIFYVRWSASNLVALHSVSDSEATGRTKWFEPRRAMGKTITVVNTTEVRGADAMGIPRDGQPPKG